MFVTSWIFLFRRLKQYKLNSVKQRHMASLSSIVTIKNPYPYKHCLWYKTRLCFLNEILWCSSRKSVYYGLIPITFGHRGGPIVTEASSACGYTRFASGLRHQNISRRLLMAGSFRLTNQLAEQTLNMHDYKNIAKRHYNGMGSEHIVFNTQIQCVHVTGRWDGLWVKGITCRTSWGLYDVPSRWVRTRDSVQVCLYSRPTDRDRYV